ncbi:MAG TPA: class I SAM-dependent methyltransferase, partial [Polyangiales bacterium]|nr:class I SAM-dependent methyltransferase [Polyangiales bacterium]
MQDAVYHQFASTFDTHWWSDHRRALVARLLASAGVEPDGSREVLEIGCGAGNEHAFLARYGRVTGVEISEAGLVYCRQRGYHQLIAGDLNEVELPHERFDLVADFHVLYHSWVRDPGEVLARLCRALKPGGHLVLSEPAYEALRRGHDEHVMAARRWTRGALLSLIRESGFEVERCTGFLTLLAPAVVGSLVLDKLRGSQHAGA